MACDMAGEYFEIMVSSGDGGFACARLSCKLGGSCRRPAPTRERRPPNSAVFPGTASKFARLKPDLEGYSVKIQSPERWTITRTCLCRTLFCKQIPAEKKTPI